MTQPATGIQRLEGVLGALKKQNRKALVAYVMAGDPTPAFTEALVPKLAEAGADIIELGFPFSDPMADGPVIQAASERALRSFPGLNAYLAMVARLRRVTPVPLVLMTYYNLVFRYGEQAFAKAAAEAGLDGAILPDLALEEAETWQKAAEAAGVASVFLEAPNTSAQQAGLIAQASRGFVYLISLKGVTGSDKGIGEHLDQRIDRLRKLTHTPLLLGFGISTPEQAHTLGGVCDGVIVGSALVGRMAAESTDAGKEQAAVALIRSFRQALDA
ncbi:MAG: tryptophan synthase subunit alpha [Deltaproteobacteria bacterium]|nr:tryptophan synthase subunit alpha [Deltaproteobacteria bacterium]